MSLKTFVKANFDNMDKQERMLWLATYSRVRAFVLTFSIVLVVCCSALVYAKLRADWPAPIEAPSDDIAKNLCGIAKDSCMKRGILTYEYENTEICTKMSAACSMAGAKYGELR